MDPTRLRDDPSQPEGLRELLHQSTRDLGTGADVARVAAKLAPIVGASTLGVITAGSAKASVFAGKVWLVSALVGGSVVAGGVVVSGVVATRVAADRPAQVVAVSNAPRDTALGTAEVAAPAEAVQAEAPAEPVSEHKTAQPRLKPRPQPAAPEQTASPTVSEPAVEPPTAAVASKASESQLLGNAQSALGSNPAQALALAEEHRQRFPGGALTQEREVIEIDALYRLGRKAEAERRAARFIATHQSSSYARRVKELMTR